VPRRKVQAITRSSRAVLSARRKSLQPGNLFLVPDNMSSTPFGKLASSRNLRPARRVLRQCTGRPKSDAVPHS